MNPEQFKEELLVLLAGAKHNINPDGFLQITKNMFTSPATIADMRAYMDSEMQKLTITRPYSFQYIICKSTAEELVFFDITPQIKEYVNCVDIIYRYYDCDTDSVMELSNQNLTL